MVSITFATGLVEGSAFDRGHGGWHHQLDGGNRPIDSVWKGKPDAYHAYQATLFAGLDPGHRLAASLLADLRDEG